MNRAEDEKDFMTAVTFAEAGELETARRYAPPRRKGRLQAWIERHLVAAAFAEEGLHAEALRLSGSEGPRPRDMEALDAVLRARGVRMFCGVLSPTVLSARP